MKPSVFDFGLGLSRLWAAPFLVCLLLTGCNTTGLSLPSWGGASRAPDYHMVDDPVAAQAAPAAQAAAGAVNCIVGKGAARFARGWYDFDEAYFPLRDSQRVNVTLRRRGTQDSMAFQAVFDTDGQKMLFCPIRSGPPGQRIVCASRYMLEDDLQAGVKRTFDIPDAVRGATISCAFDRAKMPKI